jgi:hypothetical protein
VALDDDDDDAAAADDDDERVFPCPPVLSTIDNIHIYIDTNPIIQSSSP